MSAKTYIPGFREELIGVPSQEPAQASVHAVEASGVVAELITARARRWVYALYALSSVALSAIQVGYSAGGSEHPVWLTIATAVLGFSRWFSRVAYFVKNPASLVALDKQVAPLPLWHGRGATLLIFGAYL